MFSKVVVGVDDARSDLAAIRAARSVAPEAQLHLVTVYPDEAPRLRAALGGQRELVRDDVLRQLTALREAAAVPGVSIDAVPDTSRSRGLKRYAREARADLIVLGASSRSALGRAMLGDFARGVLHGAPCPVLTLARSEGPAVAAPQVIGVAYDGSPEAKLALAVASELAQELGARIELVEAIDMTLLPAVWGMQMAVYLDELIVPEQERLDALVEGLPVEATAKAARGSAARVLGELSSRVDLVVCGSRGWGTPGRIAFGSTSDRLLHHAGAPVLIVPRGDDAPEEQDVEVPDEGAELRA